MIAQIKSDFQWWLLKKACRLYMENRFIAWPDSDRWTSIYVGVNCGAPNGSDERHIAYINRRDNNG